jgi:hypothetical protein
VEAIALRDRETVRFYDHEASVELPRFRVADALVAVAIAAFDFAAVRAMLGIPE